MDKQIVAYITPFLSSLLCGFRKGYNAQHALIRLVEKFKSSLDEGGKAGAVLMNRPKAFDCIRHALLIAKLHAYGFSREALVIINNLRHKWTTRSSSKWVIQFLKKRRSRCSIGVSLRASVIQHFH